MTSGDDQSDVSASPSDYPSIDEVLYVPITSRDQAEHFVRQWLHDGLRIPLHNEMFELRTVLDDDKFNALTTRLRELDDDAGWQSEDRDPDLWSPKGELVREIAFQIEHEWDEWDREVEAALLAHDDMFPLAPVDDDIRSPLGSIGPEEDAPYGFVTYEATAYENWGARRTSNDLPDSQRDDD